MDPALVVENEDALSAGDGTDCVGNGGAYRTSWELEVTDDARVVAHVFNPTEDDLTARLGIRGDDGHGAVFALATDAMDLPSGGEAEVEWDANALVVLDVLPATSRVAGLLQISALINDAQGEVVESHGDRAVFFESADGGAKLTANELHAGIRDGELLQEVIEAKPADELLDRYSIAPPTDAPPYVPSLDPGLGAAGNRSLTQEYTQCFKWTVRPTDSSNCTSNGGCVEAEDWGVATSCGATSTWWARNARVRLTRAGGWMLETWADANGCVTWTDAWPAHLYTATVISRARDSDGNEAWLHADEASSNPTSIPTSTYTASVAGWYPSSQAIVFTGDVSIWSTIAYAGFSLWRHNGGQANVRYLLGFDSSDSTSARAYRSDGREPDDSTTPNTVWMAIGRVSSGSPNVSQMKFIVAHEMGHGLFTQYADWVPDGQQPNRSDFDDDDAPQTDNVTFDAAPCAGGGGYSTGTYEWSSLVTFEAFASLYAARVFNDFEEHGCFVWNRIGAAGRERFDLDVERSNYTSVLEGTCCPNPFGPVPTNNGAACRPGHGTNHDWFEMLWNFYTQPVESPNACAGIDLVDMEKLFDTVAWDLTLTTTNAFSVGLDAVETGQSAGYLPACADDNWLLRGAEWGTDNAQ